VVLVEVAAPVEVPPFDVEGPLVPGPPPVEEDDASPVDPSVPDAELSAGQPVPKASANKPRKQTERLSMSRSPSRLRFCMSPTA
jgi:hypothetical protein